MKRNLAHVVGWFVVIFAVGAVGVTQALPGTNTVTSDDIVNGQVKKADIAIGAVDSSRVKNGSIGSFDIKNGDVRRIDLKNNAVSSAKVKNNSLTGSDIKDGSVGPAELGCNDGAIKGTVRITPSAAMPTSYTDSTDFVKDPYNCAGGTVQVLRVSTGWYRVQFVDNPAANAQVTVSEFFDVCNRARATAVFRNGGLEVYTTFDNGTTPGATRHCDFMVTLS